MSQTDHEPFFRIATEAGYELSMFGEPAVILCRLKGRDKWEMCCTLAAAKAMQEHEIEDHFLDLLREDV